MRLAETKWEKEIERPQKDKLLLQGPNRGNFESLSPHSHTSIFWRLPKKFKGDVEMKELQERAGPPTKMK
jgi:hypothetical protein